MIIYTPLVLNKNDKLIKRISFIILTISLCLISFLQLVIGWAFVAISGLGSGSANVFITVSLAFSVGIFGLSIYRMWKGHFWNSLALQATPSLLWIVASPYMFISFGWIPWAILLYFVRTWSFLYFRKTRIAFIFFWPFFAGSLIFYQFTIADLWKSAPNYILVILIAICIPPQILAVASERLGKYWRELTVIFLVIFFFVYPKLIDQQQYVKKLPTSTFKETEEQIKINQKSISSKNVNGFEIDLIEHSRNYKVSPTIDFELADGPKIYNESIVIPYLQSGSYCNDFVGVKPDTYEITWSLFGKSGVCAPPIGFSIFQKQNLLIYGTWDGEVNIVELSSGKVLYSDKINLKLQPFEQNNIIYFMGDVDHNDTVSVFAWDAPNQRLLWKTAISDKVSTPTLNRGQDIFSTTGKAVILDVRDYTTTDRKQFLFDLITGKMTKQAPILKLSFATDSTQSYMAKEDDYKIARNGLVVPIDVIHIGGKLVKLPEPCLTVPKEFANKIFCVSENFVEVIKK